MYIVLISYSEQHQTPKLTKEGEDGEEREEGREDGEGGEEGREDGEGVGMMEVGALPSSQRHCHFYS